MNKTAKALIELGRLTMDLGEVDRVTYHPDGIRHESDTTHTVMLGLSATAFAARYFPRLSLGLIAQYALVHDLVEALVGDVDSFQATAQERVDKKVREAGAADRLYDRFKNTLPWVPGMVYRYQAQCDPESRLVWAVDKAMPAITHILNNGTYLLEDADASRADVVKFTELEATRLETAVQDQPRILELYAALTDMLITHVYEEPR